ncbi:hypothetical protein EVAR_51740_1 [Eumeta japonica]|uniref:Uncharacterized protein n=1 Tax=Eumeta variegata TaxID=151549 RepID=A0A4C1XKP4_EUMVA|nr:hypothetical protein EVAR_51740_1 [Eumeta japonica]
MPMYKVVSRDKQACELPQSKWSTPPMDTRDRRGVTDTGLLGKNSMSYGGENGPMEEEGSDGRGSGPAEAVTSRPYHNITHFCYGYRTTNEIQTRAPPTTCTLHPWAYPVSGLGGASQILLVHTDHRYALVHHLHSMTQRSHNCPNRAVGHDGKFVPILNGVTHDSFPGPGHHPRTTRRVGETSTRVGVIFF